MSDSRANVSELEKTGAAAMRRGAAEHAREHYRTPRTDVVETDEAIKLMMDLPGVTQQGLQVDLEKDVLTVIGRPRNAGIEGLEPLHRECEISAWRREFALPGDIDSDKAEAVLRDGVLFITLPKSESVKPRKITVKAE